MVQQYEEREDKFDLPRKWSMPDLAPLVPPGGSLAEDTVTLDTGYFDTANGDLRAFGVTLRRRVGGDETGWQLKVPHGSSRTEFRSGARSKDLPKAIADAAHGLLAGDPVQPVAELQTTRTAHRVLDENSELVLEIADDLVESVPAEDGEALRWREVEVERGPAGSKKAQRRAVKLLLGAGAKPGRTRNKLDRVLGEVRRERPDGPGRGTLGALVGAYLAEQCEVLAGNDVALRTGENRVHKTRVAARRLRSTLRVFGAVFDPDRAADLDRELSWYADLLGGVRDRDVLADRLAGHLARVPAEHLRGPVAEAISTDLGNRRDAAAEELATALDGRRYLALIGQLRGWRTAPPFTEAAGAKQTAVTDYVARARKKADKRLRKAGDDAERLHRARKAMKRARYAAELGSPAKQKLNQSARSAKKLQTLLGEHQDAVMAADYLASTAPEDDAAAAYSYGVLTARELAEAGRIRADLAG